MSLFRDLFGLFQPQPEKKRSSRQSVSKETVRTTRTVVHPVVGEVTLSRSRRARRISIAVKASGAIRLSYPYGISEERALTFLDSRTEWIEHARQRIAARIAQRPTRPSLSPEEEKKRIEGLRREAKAYLPERTALLSARTGLHYRSVTIRATRSKWGSCNARCDLSLSLYLMTLPEHLRDFVILHELCHTVHHDHSSRFHALLDRLLEGQEKALQKELRQYRPE